MTADDLGFTGATKGSDWLSCKSQILSSIQSGIFIQTVKLLLPLYFATKMFENSDGVSHFSRFCVSADPSLLT